MTKYSFLGHKHSQESKDKIKASLKKRREEKLLTLLVENGQKGRGQRIKSLLIEFGYKEDICETCGQLPFHNNKKLVLQIDHVNGINTDWRIENIKVVCPNCHSQTDTFTSKSIKYKSLIQ